MVLRYVIMLAVAIVLGQALASIVYSQAKKAVKDGLKEYFEEKEQ